MGSGGDPLTASTSQKIWTRLLTCAGISWGGMQFTGQHLDLPEGGGDDVTQFVGSNEQFDFVHGSQVLEARDRSSGDASVVAKGVKTRRLYRCNSA